MIRPTRPASRAAIATTLFTALALVSGVRAGMAETFAYVGNADSNDISVFKLAESGEMTPVQTTAFTGVEKPGSSTPLAITPDHRVLIAGVRSQPFLAVSFAIDQDGPAQPYRQRAARRQHGQHRHRPRRQGAVHASYGGNKVALNPLRQRRRRRTEAGDPDRAECTRLPALTRQPFRVRDQSRLRPGVELCVRCRCGHAGAERSAVDQDAGKIRAAALRVSSQRQVRLSHPRAERRRAAYSYEAKSGAWGEIQRTTALPEGFNGKPWAADIHITPDGRFLYASERTTNTLTAYKVDATSGKLTTIGSVPTEKQPRGFNIDPTGRYLAAVGELSDGMSVYAIDQTSGALSKLKSTPPARSRTGWSF